MANIAIPTDTIKNDFSSFLGIEGNSRIFFSGRFGIGKTYFLKEFFDSSPDSYEVFHLFPINYQINTNEDILELVKYDILIELLKKNEGIFEEKDTEGIKESAILFYTWCRKNFSLNSFLQSAISTVETYSGLLADPIMVSLGKLGRPLKDLLALNKEYQKFKEEYKDGERGLAEEYIKKIESRHISESDYLSHILREKIVQQKGNKKSVLILDDLDRMDPEHIFRILNILSAYFEKENKDIFGFDLIIIVADYTNLESIFHHKYGINTDFAGYLDKFFTINPYCFDNKRALTDILDEIVKSIRNEEPKLNDAIGDSGYIKLFLSHIFSRSIDNETINLRELLKATRFQLLELKKGSYHPDPFSNVFTIIFDKAIKIAISSFSDPDTFIKKMKNIKNSKIRTEERMPFAKYITTMLTALGVKMPENENSSVTWRNYTITQKTSSREISVIGGMEEDLFYDLLIQYVIDKKYLKTNYHDYED